MREKKAGGKAKKERGSEKKGGRKTEVGRK